ncbi:MAG: 23S rRNA (uracil(1939)-C(5))-methyltransferase RlmD [Clostridia bacterium]|nr:23S rRNA (uracil(1939)-C(5))-methyltransferase RlmD [Clostridia bacterium]
MNQKNKNIFCAHQKKCGACQLQNLSYADQLIWKMATVIKLLRSYGRVSEIIGMDTPYYYRNKVQAAFGTTARGKMISGIYKSGTHTIVATDSCYLENQTADAIIVTIRKLAVSFGYSVYNEDTHTGFLRHVLVRTGDVTGQILVTLVTGTPVFPRKHDFIKALTARHPEITTVVQNINNSSTSMVLGERQTVLYGKGYIEDELCGCRFRISPKSFYQINHTQTEKLYGAAIDFADLQLGETVIDAYCGIGTIGLVAAKSGCRVIGAEINGEAVRDALVNKKINGAENAVFMKKDAGELMQELAAERAQIDVVFTDPPRSGCSREFLAALCKLQPGRVVYISCNPETQARDLRYLTAHGYKVRKIQPVDMFPHTRHIECVALLTRSK